MALQQLPYGEELREAVGEAVAAEPLQSSPRSHVWRVTLRGGERVIVKQITDKGAAGSWGADSPGSVGAGPAGAGETSAEEKAEADARFAREVAGLRLAGRAVPRGEVARGEAAVPAARNGAVGGAGDRVAVAPEVLATDTTARVMVLELVKDLGAPADWMPGYAEALARLHARGLVAEAGELPGWRGPAGADVEAFLRFAAALDGLASDDVEGELAGVIARLDGAGPGNAALLHGDPCPGNDLWTAGGVRFVDFEQAALGNGLVELAYLRIGFPTCWCAMGVPGASAAEVEVVYRETWRRVTGREVAGSVLDACVGWLIRGDALVERAHRESVDHLARAVQEDFEWGYISARERLAYRLGVVAELAGTDGDGRLERVGRWCAELLGRLNARWPGLRPLPGPEARPY